MTTFTRDDEKKLLEEYFKKKNPQPLIRKLYPFIELRVKKMFSAKSVYYTKEDVEDLTHDAFVNIIGSICTYNPKISRLTTWVGKIAENTTKTRVRKTGYDGMKSRKFSISHDEHQDDDDFKKIPTFKDSLDAYYRFNEKLHGAITLGEMPAVLTDAVNQGVISSYQLEIFQLSLLGGFSAVEIAEKLGKTRNDIDSAKSKTVRALKAWIKTYETNKGQQSN